MYSPIFALTANDKNLSNVSTFFTIYPIFRDDCSTLKNNCLISLREVQEGYGIIYLLRLKFHLV